MAGIGNFSFCLGVCHLGVQAHLCEARINSPACRSHPRARWGHLARAPSLPPAPPSPDDFICTFTALPLLPEGCAHARASLRFPRAFSWKEGPQNITQPGIGLVPSLPCLAHGFSRLWLETPAGPCWEQEGLCRSQGWPPGLCNVKETQE